MLMDPISYATQVLKEMDEDLVSQNNLLKYKSSFSLSSVTVYILPNRVNLASVKSATFCK